MSHEKFVVEFTPKFNALHIKTQEIRAKVAADMCSIYTGGKDFLPKTQVYQDMIVFWK